MELFDFMQDEGLDVIAEGLDTLKNMAHDINEVCLLLKIDTSISFPYPCF